MKTDSAQVNEESMGMSAVAYLADAMSAADRAGFESLLRDDASANAMLEEMRGVDASLRAIADAESPSLGELGRTRDASVRLARTRAVAIVADAAARRPTRLRRLPRWSIAAAAAVVVVVGVVGWMSSSAPTSLPPKPQPTEYADRQQWFDDWRDYKDLVYAFTPVEVHATDVTDATASPSDAVPEEVETQVDALDAVTAMAQE